MSNPPLPASVLLSAFRFRVQETSERSIVFTEANPICGHGSRVIIEKLLDGTVDGIWYVELSSQDRPEGSAIPVRIVEQACAFARLWRGESFKPWAPREPYDEKTGEPLVEAGGAR